MSDVPITSGHDTRVFPPYDCHFMGRKSEDVQREIKEIVYEILKNKDLSRSEEKIIREVSNETFDIMIAAHKSLCKEQRDKDYKEDSKKGRDWIGIIISIISVLTALLAVIYAVHSSGTKGSP